MDPIGLVHWCISLAMRLSIAPSPPIVDEETGEGDDLLNEKLALGLATGDSSALAVAAHFGGELEGVHLME